MKSKECVSIKMELTLDSLKDLDYGKVQVAFQRHIERAVADCMDRPGDTSTRKVMLTCLLAPSEDQSGVGDYVDLQCHVVSKLPAHKSRVFQGKPRLRGGNAQLMFDTDSPDDVEQGTCGSEDEHQKEGNS